MKLSQHRRLTLSSGIALAVLCYSVAALAGMIFLDLAGVNILSMHAALAFVFCGLSLTFGATERRSGVRALFACFALALAGTDFARHFLEIELEFLDRVSAGLTQRRTHMAPGTAVAMTVTAATLLVPARGVTGLVVKDVLATAVFFGGYIGAVSWTLRSPESLGLVAFTQTTFDSALLFMTLAIGIIMTARRGMSRSWLASALTSDDVGGRMLRVLLPVALLLPALLGWVRLRLENSGYIDTVIGVELMVLTTSVAFAVIVLLNANKATALSRMIVSINADLVRADRLKNEFLSIASHELRTPLVAIRNLAETNLARWDAIDDESRRRHMEMIESQASRLIRMTRNLLTVSRIESGDLKGEVRPVNVWSTVHEIVRYHGYTDVHARGDQQAQALVDRDHLNQMVVNLLANAHTHGKPPIAVEVSHLSDCVQIAVCDSGEGVPAGSAAKLFQRYVQTGDGSGRGGSGLGLSIVRGLAEAYGGSAWYEPGKPGGSRFVLRLPATTGG